jgi:hypothetical protein
VRFAATFDVARPSAATDFNWKSITYNSPRISSLRREFQPITLAPMSETKRGRGRPKVKPDTGSVTIALPRDVIREAEALVPAFDAASPLGVRHNRIDVLRAAVVKGIAALRAQVEPHTP